MQHLETNTDLSGSHWGKKEHVRPEKIPIFWKNGKIVISVKTERFSRSRMMKRISPLESSRKI